MPDTPSIVIAKTLNYRGAAETWTNRYHFSGTVPSDRAGWLALMRAIWNSERGIMGTEVKFVGGSAYVAGNEAAVQMYNATQIGGDANTNSGGITSNTGAGTPGDAALWVRWATDDRNTKNKPIYLRKYFHGFPLEADGDIPSAAARAAAGLHGTKMMDGTLPGGVKVCGPQGAVAVSSAVSQYTTTRTLKRNARSPI